MLHLSRVVHEPIYDRFMSCTVNGFLSLYKPYILILIISQAGFENRYETDVKNGIFWSKIGSRFGELGAPSQTCRIVPGVPPGPYFV